MRINETINIHIAQLIELLQRVSVTKEDFAGTELYGFIGKIPKHRVLLGQVVASGKHVNGSEFYDLTLPSPKKFQERISFDNFRSLYIYTGVLNLSNGIDDILCRVVNDAELIVLNDIFKGELYISKAHITITITDILKMLNAIRNQFV